METNKYELMARELVTMSRISGKPSVCFNAPVVINGKFHGMTQVTGIVYDDEQAAHWNCSTFRRDMAKWLKMMTESE